MQSTQRHAGGPRKASDGTHHRHSDPFAAILGSDPTVHRVAAVLNQHGYDARFGTSLYVGSSVRALCSNLLDPVIPQSEKYSLDIPAILRKPSAEEHAAAVVRMINLSDRSEAIIMPSASSLRLIKAPQHGGVSSVLDIRRSSGVGWEVTRAGIFFTREAFIREARLLSEPVHRGFIADLCNALSTDALKGARLRRMQVSQENSCPGFSVLARTSTGSNAFFFFENWSQTLPIVEAILVAEAARINILSRVDQELSLRLVNNDLKTRGGTELHSLDRIEAGVVRLRNTSIPFRGVLWCYHRYGLHCLGLIGDQSEMWGTTLGFFRDPPNPPTKVSDFLRGDRLKVRAVAGLPPQLAALSDATLRVERVLDERDVRFGVYSDSVEVPVAPDSQVVLPGTLLRFLEFQSSVQS